VIKTNPDSFRHQLCKNSLKDAGVLLNQISSMVDYHMDRASRFHCNALSLKTDVATAGIGGLLDFRDFLL
jgi:hypothetical protein